MNAIIAQAFRTNLRRNIVWLFLLLCTVLIISIAVVREKWLFILLIGVPVAIFFSLLRPLIFPLGLYVAILPFDALMSLGGSPGAASLTRLIGILAIIILFVKGLFEKKLLRMNMASLWMTLFVIYALLSALWAVDPQRVISIWPTIGGLLLLYLVVSLYRVTEDEFDFLILLIVAGGLVAVMITIANQQVLVERGGVERISLTMGDRATQLNRFAFYLLAPIAACMKKVVEEGSKTSRVLFTGAFLAFLYAIVLSGSRGGMMGVGVIIIVYLVAMRRKMSVWIVVLTVCIIIASYVPVIYFTGRFQDAVETGGAGRLFIWKTGLLSLQKYWITGVGFNNYVEAFNQFVQLNPYSDSKLYRAGHNIYLSALVELGILGFFLLIYSLWNHYRILRNNAGRDLNKLMLKASLLGMLTSSFFVDSITIKSFWMVLMLTVMYQNSIGNRDNQNTWTESAERRAPW